MRLVFAGTPEFARRALQRLADSGHDVRLVLSQPDRPAGRGMRPVPSAVKRFAESLALPVLQPVNLRDERVAHRLREAEPEIVVVAAYGMLLPRAILQLPPHGAINIHASLLPRWRGAAPIQRALLAGDARTGISIMQMDEGLDTGPVLLQRAIDISPYDDAGTLHDRLADLGAQTVADALSALEEGRLRPLPQPREGVTYAAKIDKSETVIDWSRPAEEIERMIRAFRPAPGAQTFLQGEPIKIWRARALTTELPPAALKVEHGCLVVGCGIGSIAVDELQRAGKRRVRAEEFLRGRRVGPEARFQGPDASAT